MPKISQLPTGSTLTGAEEIPMVQSGVTRRTTPAALSSFIGSGGSGANLGLYNVKDYGATGDGVTNDTSAIQSAINAAGTAGGGYVFLPAGTYVIQPATISTLYALFIDYSNITLGGAGYAFTKLKFRLYDGSDPATHWPIVAGLVQRGHGIWINGGHSNVTLEGFELDGGAGKTNNASFPASTIDGDGWDLTHKGIVYQVNVAHDRMIIRNCYIHRWRGEIIYHGGNLFQRHDILDNIIADTNASGLNPSSNNLTVRGNEIYDCYSDGIECGYFGGRLVISDNYVHGCAHNGMSILPVGATYGVADIHDNHFLNCSTVTSQQPTLYLGGPRNVRAYNNLFVDCTGFNIYLDCNDSYAQADNTEVYGNRFVADQSSINSMIYISTGTNAVTRLQIHDNSGITTLAARGVGQIIRRAVNLDENLIPGNIGSGYRNYNNELMDGSQDTSETRRSAIRLPDTAAHIVGHYKDTATFVRRIFVDYTVSTAATNLVVDAAFTLSGVGKTRNIVASASYAVGSYSAMVEIFADGEVTVTATAGTANNIFINTEIIALP